MSRPSRPWLLPIACAVLGVVWVLWLAYESEPAGEGSADRAPSSQSTPESHPGGLSQMNPADSRPEARGAAIPPSTARAADETRSSTTPPLQLVFQTPATANVGDAFDVRVSIAARQPIARIVFGITYEPGLLKARSLEAIDYVHRTPGERAFAINELSDGHVEVVVAMKGREPPPANVPLVQFEVLSPGRTQIRIASIDVSDASDRAVPWAATGRESQISLN